MHSDGGLVWGQGRTSAATTGKMGLQSCTSCEAYGASLASQLVLQWDIIAGSSSEVGARVLRDWQRGHQTRLSGDIALHGRKSLCVHTLMSKPGVKPRGG